jgi:hypothetical protein
VTARRGWACRPQPLGVVALSIASAFLAACAGGAPLLHTAHVLKPGEVQVGGGVAGQLALIQLPTTGAPADQQNRGSLQNLSVSPGLAPWGAGRVGIVGSNEAGLTYTGREIRIDGRHAFEFGKLALSIGLGASAIVPQTPGGSNPAGVWGGGGDIPILIGAHSTGDIIAFWVGPRAGFEVFTGQVQLSDYMGGTPLYAVTAYQLYAGITAGMRVGFRHVHVAIEVNASYHAANGSYQETMGANGIAPTAGASASVQQLSITPAGALEVNF